MPGITGPIGAASQPIASKAGSYESGRTPGNFFFTVGTDADPAIGIFFTFFLDPAARCATHFDVQRSEGSAGAGDVVIPRRLVTFQVKTVPFAYSLG